MSTRFPPPVEPSSEPGINFPETQRRYLKLGLVDALFLTMILGSAVGLLYFGLR
jgi:hypothetical protein